MPVETRDIPPAPEGMNTEEDPWNISDLFCRMAVDAVFHKPNTIRRRGPVKTAVHPNGTLPAFEPSWEAQGIVATEQPNDVWRVGVMLGTTNDAVLAVYSTDYTTKTNISLGTVVFDPAQRYQFSTAPHPWGGTIIAWARGYYGSGAQYAGHWHGADKPTYNTGTITVTQGAKTITGVGTAWLANVVPGMFLYSKAEQDPTGVGLDRTFIGTVQSVTDNTHLTLIDGALFDVTARGYRLESIRTLTRRVAKGQITTTTASKTVTGTNTKFRKQYLHSPRSGGKWAIFRSNDMEYVGVVDTVASDTSLQLVANAEINCNKDKFVAIDIYDKEDLAVADAQEPGFLAAPFANRMWYGNRRLSNRHQPLSPSRVWFSDVFDPEAVDYSADGDHLLIPSSTPPVRPLTGLAGTPSTLLCFKEDETYGVFGTDETNFALRKLLDDGALTNMTIQYWNEGVIWAGKKGVWFWDGNEPFNILDERLTDFYQTSVETFPNRTYNAWSMRHKDEYILYIERATPPLGPIKDANTDNSTGDPYPYLAMCIHLPTRACSLWTNFALKGAVNSPFEETLGTLYIVNELDPITHADEGGRVCQAEDLFEGEGVDEIFTSVVTPAENVLGPDLYLELKRYDMGSPQQKKLFKQLQMLYMLETVSGDYVEFGLDGGVGTTDYNTNNLRFASLVSLNEVATVSNSRWRPTRVKDGAGSFVAGFQNKRIKFNKRSQHIGFRIWQANTTGIKHIEIGPMAIGFKWKRPGTV